MSADYNAIVFDCNSLHVFIVQIYSRLCLKFALFLVSSLSYTVELLY